MIRNFHCIELRELIANVLKPTIKKQRSKEENQFYGIEPTEDEVDEFIISTRYFDPIVKDFLLSGNGYWLLDDEDIIGFINNLKLWIEIHLE